MAVDTQNRRASCLGIALPFRVVLPNPDGAALTAADRRQCAYAYRLSAGGDDDAATPGGVFRAREPGLVFDPRDPGVVFPAREPGLVWRARP